ncbi:hypothetical protein NKR23_g6866 [Pleurostoma richardsiae]|uniref:SH3 domain-containing protein n=1 Tax=Pleurostoma richardsiae TaxID=41990 RepID=A0AA38VNP7_9PEZI|nr:hypothetical protein NKR23_g6866 [Pleurostoma richardsiae]
MPSYDRYTNGPSNPLGLANESGNVWNEVMGSRRASINNLNDWFGPLPESPDRTRPPAYFVDDLPNGYGMLGAPPSSGLRSRRFRPLPVRVPLESGRTYLVMVVEETALSTQQDLRAEANRQLDILEADRYAPHSITTVRNGTAAIAFGEDALQDLFDSTNDIRVMLGHRAPEATRLNRPQSSNDPARNLARVEVGLAVVPQPPSILRFNPPVRPTVSPSADFLAEHILGDVNWPKYYGCHSSINFQVIADVNCTSPDLSMLSFSVGQIITVMSTGCGDWWYGEYTESSFGTQRRGLFHRANVKYHFPTTSRVRWNGATASSASSVDFDDTRSHFLLRPSTAAQPQLSSASGVTQQQRSAEYPANYLSTHAAARPATYGTFDSFPSGLSGARAGAQYAINDNFPAVDSASFHLPIRARSTNDWMRDFGMQHNPVTDDAIRLVSDGEDGNLGAEYEESDDEELIQFN